MAKDRGSDPFLEDDGLSSIPEFQDLVLSCAYSQPGLLKKGCKNFREMKYYNVSLKLEHYSCYTDLLAQSGYIEEALSLVSSIMHCEHNKYF